jgi:hypothetical protein
MVGQRPTEVTLVREAESPPARPTASDRCDSAVVDLTVGGHAVTLATVRSRVRLIWAVTSENLDQDSALAPDSSSRASSMTRLTFRERTRVSASETSRDEGEARLTNISSSTVSRMESYEIENLRRSLAMLSENSRAPLTTRQAEDLIRTLNEAEADLSRLRDGLRQLLDSPST